MLSSISPVGEHARRQRWSVTVGAYLVGSVLGGTVVGLVVGSLGSLLLGELPEGTRLIALVCAATLGLVLDLFGHVPSLHRQVDERWLTTYRGWVYGGGFGLQLGTGIVTIIPSSIVWVVWIGAMLTVDPTAGTMVGAVFGLTRALPLLAAGRIRTVGALRRTLGWMDRVRPLAQRAVVGGQALLTVVTVGLWATRMT
jgi:sulfite exporter TauE/SafE